MCIREHKDNTVYCLATLHYLYEVCEGLWNFCSFPQHKNILAGKQTSIYLALLCVLVHRRVHACMVLDCKLMLVQGLVQLD